MEIVICGDFNINYLVNSNKKQLNLLLQSYSYSDIVKFPTGTSMTPSTTIDNIFTDGTRLKNIVIKLITYY
jgi:endonuclease/exonuclease/phosphatase family metal-dependent hydrolase